MTAVRLQRTIAAKPAQVYRAWLDPELLAQWMKPGSPAGHVRADVDERVGGHFRIFTADGGGFDAELLDLVPDRRVSYRWAFVGPDRRDGPVFDSVLTVTFDDAEAGTLLTLVHERLDALAAAMPEVAGQVETGWSRALDNLSTLAAVRL
jgi:uncharacterized protein YndB with AHSA1/START domain